MLFSAPMVRAILDGRKTVTRRLVAAKDQEYLDQTSGKYDDEQAELSFQFTKDGHSGPGVYVWISEYPEEGSEKIACRYGLPGDRLWVKESIRRTDYGAEFIADGAPTKAECWPWKNKALPSMFMPYGLRRITLEIVSVRIERLQDITGSGAQAEGVEDCDEPNHDDCFYGGSLQGYRCAFERLWESINGAGSWNANPWVWRIAFNRIS